MVKCVAWILYSPRRCKNGAIHYQEEQESSDEFHSILEARLNFNNSTGYFDVMKGSFVRYSVHDFGYISFSDSDTEESFVTEYSDFNGKNKIKLKWRLYRTHACSDEYSDSPHCTKEEESQQIFLSYEDCEEDYKKNCAYIKRFPSKSVEMRVECFEYDENFL
jgi:hypothetical protein